MEPHGGSSTELTILGYATPKRAKWHSVPSQEQKRRSRGQQRMFLSLKVFRVMLTKPWRLSE
jgi:hypothetical protein